MALFKTYKISQLPIFLILLTTLLVAIGATVLYSAGGKYYTLFSIKHIVFFVIGLLSMFVVSLIHPKMIEKYSYIVYFMSIVLLVGVEFFGIRAMGAKRWLGTKSFRFQPAEIAKISLILGLAKYLSLLGINRIHKLSYTIPAFFIIMLPAILIIKQPDLGTGMIIIFIGAIMMFGAGVRFWKFMFIGISVCVAIPFIWSKLHDYQKNRILVFLNPELDSLGIGYNIIQSKIAIGSGGIFGKGFLGGTQSHLSFLPEHQTDFIFATFAEEFGFVGAIILIVIYLMILLTNTMLAFKIHNQFVKLIIIGVNALIFCHVYINIGMVSGIMPVVGVPLPFLSLGGANLVSTMIGLGLIVNGCVHKNSKF